MDMGGRLAWSLCVQLASLRWLTQPLPRREEDNQRKISPCSSYPPPHYYTTAHTGVCRKHAGWTVGPQQDEDRPGFSFSAAATAWAGLILLWRGQLPFLRLAYINLYQATHQSCKLCLEEWTVTWLQACQVPEQWFTGSHHLPFLSPTAFSLSSVLKLPPSFWSQAQVQSW